MTKKQAIDLTERLNKDKGYYLYHVYFIGNSMAHLYGLSIGGWYVFNTETNKLHNL